MDSRNEQWDHGGSCHDPIDGDGPGVRAVADLVRTLTYFAESLPSIRIEEDILTPARWCYGSRADEARVLCDILQLLFRRLLISAATSVAFYLATAESGQALEQLNADIRRMETVVGNAYRASCLESFKARLDKGFADAPF